MSEIIVRAERDYDYIGRQVVVRIRYRRPPARRWRKVLVVPQDGQSVGEIMGHAREIAEAYDRGEIAI